VIRAIAGAVSLAAAAIAAACSRPANGAADLVVIHAAIWTGDPARPDARALALIGDRIVDVGSDDEIGRWRGTATQVIDAGGRRVVPGFNDAHVHFATGGAQLTQVDLRDAGSPDEFARRIIERARIRPGDWILGGQWDERRWSPKGPPTRGLIDDGTNGTPVFVMHVDGRMALANSAALGRAGITDKTPDPVGGVIVRDDRGLPTGLLTGAAMDAVARAIPKPSDEERRQTILRGLEHAASLGVTSVQDMNPDAADVAIYTDLASRGRLTARIYAVPIETAWFEQARIGIRRAFGSPSLRLGAVTGDAAPPPFDPLVTRLMAADHNGLQLAVNAADAGVATTLDLLTAILRANGERDRRFRIEHAERATDADVDRLTSLHAIASLQPAASGANIGAIERLVRRDARLALATDWPSASLNPMIGLAAFAAHATVAAALAAATSGGAFAEFQETEKGILARGELADLVVLSDDILSSIPRDRIAGVTVLTTIAGGKVVHQRRP
jgi:predicted amidohydrolase YtcJ